MVVSGYKWLEPKNWSNLGENSKNLSNIKEIKKYKIS